MTVQKTVASDVMHGILYATVYQNVRKASTTDNIAAELTEQRALLSLPQSTFRTS